VRYFPLKSRYALKPTKRAGSCELPALNPLHLFAKESESMNIVTRELLVGPEPTEGAKEFAKYFLRLTRIEELNQRRMIAYYARSARTAGLSHREIGEILGHTEGWVRQYLKDNAAKTDLWEFADSGFRGDGAALVQFYKDLALTSNMDHKLHLCAEYGLSDDAVAELLRLNPDRMKELMADYRADAAA
jgi:hypothetical protein